MFEGLGKAGVDEAEVVTIYYGNNIGDNDAEKVVEKFNMKYPGKQVEVVHGGQPHYDYIISLE